MNTANGLDVKSLSEGLLDSLVPLRDAQLKLEAIVQKAAESGINLQSFAKQSPSVKQFQWIVVDCILRAGNRAESCVKETQRRIERTMSSFQKIMPVEGEKEE